MLATHRSAVRLSEKSIRKDILDYLARNPQAQDTLDGIAGWWLLEEEFIRTKETVQKVLHQLVGEGVLQTIEGPDGKIHYRAGRLDQS